MRFTLVEDTPANTFTDLSLIAQHLGDGVVVLDASGTILWANPGFCDLVNADDAEELCGRVHSSMLDTEQTCDQHLRRLKLALADGQEARVELCRKRLDGGEVWTEATISPIRKHDGHLSYFIVAERDITERHQREVHMERQMVGLYKVLLESTRDEDTSYPYSLPDESNDQN